MVEKKVPLKVALMVALMVDPMGFGLYMPHISRYIVHGSLSNSNKRHS
jgi:hypothetical protein